MITFITLFLFILSILYISKSFPQQPVSLSKMVLEGLQRLQAENILTSWDLCNQQIDI